MVWSFWRYHLHERSDHIMKIEIRRATVLDAPAIGKVHVISWRETYCGIVTQAYLDELNVSKRQEIWKQIIESGQYVCVAEYEGNIIGFADGGKFRGQHTEIKGELYAIYVLADFHRKGIGKALFSTVSNFLNRNDLLPFGIWVLAENPASRFYQSMGGKIIDEKWEDIGGDSFREVLYTFT